MRRDRSFLGTKKAEGDIKYDFKDPVLNKENYEAQTRFNQIQYRMRSNPSYLKKVLAQLNSYHNNKDKRSNYMPAPHT